MTTWIGLGEKNTYWDGTSLQCRACRDNCATCTNDITCTVCEPGFVLYTRTEIEDGVSKTVKDCIPHE